MTGVGVPSWRAMTRLGRSAAVLVVVLLGCLMLAGLGLRWDPFNLSRRRVENAEASAAQAQAQAAARTAEAQGQAGQLARLDTVLQTLRSLDRATNRSIQEARAADDAELPLPISRFDRLRDHDSELCRIAPRLVGCAAAPDAAAIGDETL